jgi:hypothetical protein
MWTFTKVIISNCRNWVRSNYSWNDEFFKKQQSPRNIIDFGIINGDNEKHQKKQKAPIGFAVFGMETNADDLQP